MQYQVQRDLICLADTVTVWDNWDNWERSLLPMYEAISYQLPATIFTFYSAEGKQEFMLKITLVLRVRATQAQAYP